MGFKKSQTLFQATFIDRKLGLVVQMAYIKCFVALSAPCMAAEDTLKHISSTAFTLQLIPCTRFVPHGLEL